MKVRWWARFAVRGHEGDATKKILLASEHEPFSSLVDVTDCCAGSRVSAEVWLEPEEGEARDLRVHAGWIDELGRMHARRSSMQLARRLAAAITSDGASYDVEVTSLDSGIHADVQRATGLEVWALIPRRSDPDEARGAVTSAYPYHRFLVATIRIG